MKYKKLFTPGPTPIPERVLAKMSEPIFHHRTDEFKILLNRIEKKLQTVFCTKNPVYILTSSGSGAMEAAVVNLFRKGDKALTIETGKFGQRWGELCLANGIPVVRHQIEWGATPQPDEVKTWLTADGDFKAVFLTHSETSTGAALPLQEIAKVIKKNSSALIIVDGITSVSALPLKMDDWELDLVISASQKGFMCPPGLAFVACSEKAQTAINNSDLPRYYFDLRKYAQALESDFTPFTPATTLLSVLDEALTMMTEEGLHSIWQRHQKLATGTRAAMRALGLELLAKNPSNALTAVKIPKALREKNILQLLAEQGFIVAGGQCKLKDQILRISHLGYYNENDIIALIRALEDVLSRSGWEYPHHAGVTAFKNHCR
ncbi:MAG TPA: alanine--glyoxylate aminotransferase family protein [Bacteroidetes bacterium]|nr:alanine--glyoxylate aminotransferase family protein [Bacteroidota bacterium]